MDFAYPALFDREPDGRYTVTFPDLPDAITQGEDRDDAIEMAGDCLAETIGARIAERADIPVPSPLKRGQVRIAVGCGSSSSTAQGASASGTARAT